MAKEIQKGLYRHFKGLQVEVIGVAFHSETLEEMVVYIHKDAMKGKGENTMWVRPKDMFLENVIVDGKEIPRFTYMQE